MIFYNFLIAILLQENMFQVFPTCHSADPRGARSVREVRVPRHFDQWLPTWIILGEGEACSLAFPCK